VIFKETVAVRSYLTRDSPLPLATFGEHGRLAIPPDPARSMPPALLVTAQTRMRLHR
jgi:hypothetical protein